MDNYTRSNEGEICMAIEWFNPSLGTPTVTIAEYGVGFNKAAIEALGNPKKIKMGFDKEDKVVVVIPTQEDDASAITFASKERNGYIRISSKDFARFILRYLPDLKLNKAIRCLARIDDGSGALHADLKQIVESDSESSEEQDQEEK